MTTDMSPADLAHRQRLTDIHVAAAGQFGCTLDQKRRWGWYDRSVSGGATRDGQRVWVRTVTEQPQWAEAPFWVGNTEANKVIGVPKPIVLDVTQQLREYFGERIDPQVERWVASHGDLHWANVTAPRLAILDWEQWGLAPYGYDVATLYCHSLLVPQTAAAIRDRFTHMLDSADGRRSQLLAIARMLSRTRMGDYTDLVVPLHRLADEILGR